MRHALLAIVAAGALATAGAAMAQTSEAAGQVTTPGDTGNYPQTTGGSGNEAGSRHQRYLMRIETLREKVAKTKAQDGGQLTAEHEAHLKRELEKLNRIYGVNTG